MKHAKKQRGMAMLIALGFTFVVLALGLGIMQMTTSEQVNTQYQGESIAARNVAEAGIDKAFLQESQDPTWRNTDNSAAFVNAPVADGSGKTVGTFTVDPLVDLGADQFEVKSHGTVGRTTKNVRIIAYYEWGMPFNAAVFGRNGVVEQNGDTDSYNSNLGSYYSQTPGYQGDVRTDASTPTSITLGSQGYIHGKVIFGPGTDLSLVPLTTNPRIQDGDSSVADNVLVSPSTTLMPRVVLPANARPITNIPGITSMYITSTVTIPGGTWYCNGINLAGQDRINTDSSNGLPVIIYVNGTMCAMGQGIVNNGDTTGAYARPSNLQIYGVSGVCTSVTVGGNGATVAAIYAPDADVTLNGNGGYFGSVAGKTVNFSGNNTQIHYDVALKAIGGVVVGCRSKSWEED